jgi:iron complex outermembrane receptor protein
MTPKPSSNFHTSSRGTSAKGAVPAVVLCVISTSLFLCPSAEAQSQGANVAPPSDQQVVKLDPFTVVDRTDTYSLPDSSAATKIDVPNDILPISVQEIGRQVLQDQQILRLQDALQNVSGVLPNNEGGSTSDDFTIRGFDSGQLTYEDGLKTDQSTNGGFTTDMANVDRIEIAKGPASVLYGQGEPGGLINIVTKQPLQTPFFALDQEFGSFDTYRGTLDASGPLNASHSLLYRLNVAFEDSSSYRDFVRNHRLIAFPTLAWQPSSKTRVTLEFKVGSGYEIYDPGVPFMNGVPAPVPLSANFADPNANYGPIHDDSAKIVINQQIAPSWDLKFAAKTAYISGPVTNFQDYAGDPDASGNLPFIGFITNYFKHYTNQAVLDLTGKFTTGSAAHTLLLGTDYFHYDGRYDGNFYLPPTINIFDPVYNQPYTLPDPSTDFPVSNGENAYGAYVQDFVALPANVYAIAGVRVDSETSYDTGFGVAARVHDPLKASPRIGVLWKFHPDAAVYASYTGNYGDTALGAMTATGALLPPEGAQQYEAGIKTEWLNNKLTVTTGIYQLTKENVPATDPQNPDYSIAVGKARSRGVEVDAAGDLGAGWKIIGSYSYIDCVTTEDQNLPSYQGLRFPNVPFDSASLWLTYELPAATLKGLKIGFGGFARGQEVGYETSASGLTYAPLHVPGFAVANAMASYAWNIGRTRMSVQVNVNNVLDRKYFESIGYTTGYPGAPFNILAAFKLER